MKNLIKYKKGEVSWIRWIKKRLKNNLNFIALYQGPTGSGKTWASISTAQMIDKEFSVDQIVFSFKELMDVINADWFKKKKIKIIVFDEPQVSISNRAWQSKTNRLMNYLTSTFRHQNIILLFAAPYSDFLDKQTIRLIHCIFECMGINKRTKMSKLKPLIQQYNSDLKKTYKHPLYIMRRRGRTSPLRTWRIRAPTKEMIRLYEEKKEAFTYKLNKKISAEIDEASGAGKGDIKTMVIPPEYRKELTEKQRRVMEVLGEVKTMRPAAKILNLSATTVQQHHRAATRKGYFIKEFEKNSPLAHENAVRTPANGI